jgi:hypothetical protein
LKGFFDVPFRALFVYAGNSTVLFLPAQFPFLLGSGRLERQGSKGQLWIAY